MRVGQVGPPFHLRLEHGLRRAHAPDVLHPDVLDERAALAVRLHIQEPPALGLDRAVRHVDVADAARHFAADAEQRVPVHGPAVADHDVLRGDVALATGGVHAALDGVRVVRLVQRAVLHEGAVAGFEVEAVRVRPRADGVDAAHDDVLAHLEVHRPRRRAAHLEALQPHVPALPEVDHLGTPPAALGVLHEVVVPVGDVALDRAGAQDGHVGATVRADERAMRHRGAPVRPQRRAHHQDRVVREVQHRPLLHHQRDVALEPERARDPLALRKHHASAAGLRGRVDGRFDGLGAGRAVRLRAVVRNREVARGRRPLRDGQRKRRALHDQRPDLGFKGKTDDGRERQARRVNIQMLHFRSSC